MHATLWEYLYAQIMSAHLQDGIRLNIRKDYYVFADGCMRAIMVVSNIYITYPSSASTL